jgi:hypothetical protein
MTNPTQPSDPIRDALIKQAIGTFKRKFGIEAEPGWFLDDWNRATLYDINMALGTAPTPTQDEPVAYHSDSVSLKGIPGHIVVSVTPPRGAATMVYFHNRT